MTLQAFGQALQNFGDLTLLLSMLAGLIVGLIIGILPGIGTLVTMALFLPFLFMMSPETGLPFMVAIGGSAVTGGAITAILLNMPGETANTATLIDGFPMTQKGQAGRALGAALAASGMGGVLSVLLALVMVPLVMPMIMAIRTADMVFVILLGLCFIGVLGERSMVKGSISGLLGLLISFIGFQAGTGASRFTFGSLYLYDGLQLIPVVLGLFALPEMASLAASGSTLARTKEMTIKGMADVSKGIKDVFRRWPLWLRSTVIGYIVGVIPGIGTSTAMFVSYGQAKQTSKHPEEFGSGSIEGVIAPQSSINACQAGDLLITLALGIPGSASMAILLGAFLMLGLIPGPRMMIEHLDLSFTLFLVIAVSHVIGTAICLVAAPHLAKVAYVPGRILVPLVTVLIFVGAFTYRGYYTDIIVTLIFGALGMVMKKAGYPRPALTLGFVMGYLFELYFFMAVDISGALFFVRPISLTIIFLIIIMFCLKPIRALFGRRLRRGVKAA